MFSRKNEFQIFNQAERIVFLQYVQGVPSIGTHFRFQFLTFLIVLSKKSNYAILTQMHNDAFFKNFYGTA